MGYDTVNHVTQMGAKGGKVFKILILKVFESSKI